jgi:hypothetical protein
VHAGEELMELVLDGKFFCVAELAVELTASRFAEGFWVLAVFALLRFVMEMPGSTGIVEVKAVVSD